ncbi:MAG: hypothetical protein ACLQIQ_18115 [Beijerinckiaceae bacterium]
MIKKTLLCAVSVWPLACMPALAGGAQTYEPGRFGAHRHWAPPRSAAWHAPRPTVVRGYYPDGYGLSYPSHAPGVRAYAAYPPTAALDQAAPVVAYRNATAYVPVTTYAQVPVRIYYIPQQQPYYNVPPYYAVPEPCTCD